MSRANSIDQSAYIGSGRATMVAVVAAAVTLPFGESVIGVQLDAIARAFAADGVWLGWVVNAYMLTFATSILGAGLLADRFGRRRLFIVGLLLSGLANTAAIAAPGVGWLIALRAASGLGAGTLLATGPALLTVRFPQGEPARARAFAAFGAAAGSGIAFGPLVGGVLMDWVGWRGVFAVYLPFIGLALALLPWIARAPGEADAEIDRTGVVLFTLALAALVWMIEGAPGGLVGRSVLLAAALGLLFVLYQLERGRAQPAIDPRVFTHPLFRAMSLTMVCWQIGVAISMVYVPAVAIAGLDVSPALAGAVILPMAVTLFGATPGGPWLVSRFGVRVFIAVCIGLMAVGDGVVWTALHSAWAPSLAGSMTGLALIGLGGGAANGSLDNLALSTISPRRAGMAAGVFQTVRIGSAALAVAVAGSVLAIGGHGDRPEQAAAAASDIVTRYGDIAGIGALIMALVGVFCITRPAIERPDPQGEQQ